MKIASFILFCFAIASCKPAKKIEYIEGLVNCHSKKQKNPKELTFEDFQPHCLVGAQMPSFTAKTIDEKTIDDDYFKGKVTIVNFWFESCHPCVAEIPGFNEIVKKYGRNKVNFLAIGRDRKQDIKDFLNKHPWNFDHVADGEKLIFDTFDLVWGFPTTFLVNKRLEIVMAFTGGFNDENVVQGIQDKLIPMIETELKKRG